MSIREYKFDGSVSELSTDRRWIRRSKPVALWWEGLLVLFAFVALILYGLWPFARNDIEASVRSETRAALDAKGYTWVQIAVSGQDVELRGVQPVARAGDGALAIARTASCTTWAGRLGCPISVSAQFSDQPAPRSAPVAVAAVGNAAACEKTFNDIVAESQIEFASGSAAISPRSGSVLDALAKAAGNCDGVIRIEGHTDAVGAASLNVALSASRANAVAAALVERGIPKARLEPQGFGARQPIGDNATAEGRAKNRRIEFRVVQKESKGDQS